MVVVEEVELDSVFYMQPKTLNVRSKMDLCQKRK